MASESAFNTRKKLWEDKNVYARLAVYDRTLQNAASQTRQCLFLDY
jgi:hypothetical protein